MTTQENVLQPLDHYRYMVELNPQVPWIADSQGRLLDFSSRWLELTGLTREQALAEGWTDVPHPDDLPRMLEAWTRSMTTGTPFDLEHRIRVADGSYRWMRTRAFPRRDDTGAVVNWYGTTEDIEERVTTQKALEASEARYRYITDSMPHIVWSCRADGSCDYFNAYFGEYTGVPVEKCLEWGWQAILHPDDVEPTTARWQRSLETGELYEAEFRLRTAGGTYRWNLARGLPVKNERGEITAWFGTATDIDKQKRQEEQERFLARLAAETRLLTDPDEVLWASMRLIGEHLQVSRSTYNLVDEAGDQILGYRDYCIEGESLRGTLPLSALGQALLNELRAGHAVAVADTSADPRAVSAFQAVYHPLGIRSFIAAPLIKEGRIISILSVNMTSPRAWTPEETELVAEVAERTWMTVQNAREALDRQRAEQAVHSSETRFRLLVEQSPLSIQVLSPEGRTVRVNRTWEQLWGLTLEDLHDYNMLEDRQLIEKGIMPYIQRAFSGEAVSIPPVLYDTEQTLPDRTRREESKRWTQAVMYPVKDEAGHVREVVLIHEDITERIQAEEERARLTVEIANQRTRLDDLISSVPGVVWEAWGQPDREHQRIDYVSDYVETLLGYTVEEWVSTPNFWLTIVHPEDREKAARVASEAWDSGRQHTNEFRWMTKSGQALWCESYAVVIKDAQGAPIGMRGVTIDVSERKRLEMQLREETRTLEVIHHIGQRLSAELDLEKMVQAATDAATRLTGAQFGAFFYNVTNPAGESYLLYTISGVPREAFAQFPMPRNTDIFAPTFAGEGTVRLEDVTKDSRYGRNAPYYGKPKGHLPVVSYLAVPVISRSGEVLGGLFFGHEQPGMFTERHEHIVEGLAAQAAIAIDNARLFRAERERSEQLAMAVREVHHRVKNSLQGVSALLEMQILSEETTVSAEVIRDCLSQIKTIALVHDLLAHDKPIGNVDVAAVLSKLVAMLSATLGTLEAPLPIRLEAAPLYIPIRPATALALVVNELITNAAKHSTTQTSEGSSHHDNTISIRLQPQQDAVCVSVQDRGPGFPSNFDPVRDAHIGLEVVQTLVSNDLKGRIAFRNNRAESPEETGTDERGARVEIVFNPASLAD